MVGGEINDKAKGSQREIRVETRCGFDSQATEPSRDLDSILGASELKLSLGKAGFDEMRVQFPARDS